MKHPSLISALAFLSMLLFAWSCEKGPIAGNGNDGKVTLEVIAERPMPCDDQTRVTLTGEELDWEGNETLGVLFSAAQDTSGGPRAILNSISDGRFAGEIDLSRFEFSGRTMSDLKAIVVPADRNTRFECKSTGNRVATPIAATQVQHRNGVLNGEYVPLFATVSEKDLKKRDDGRYTLDGIQLKYGCTLLEYNIYGNNPETIYDEVLESVWIQCSGKAITGVGYWTGSKFSISGNISDPITSILEEKCTVKGKTLDNCIKLYAATLPRYEGNATPTLKKIKVTTNKAVYEKDVNVTLKLRAGHVLRLGLDLGTFVRTPVGKEEFTLNQGAVDSIIFTGYPQLSGYPVTVYYYVPDGDPSKMPILFAMHGSGRNGKGTLNTWKSIADNKKVVVIAPTFYKDYYPESRYQLGNVSWSNYFWNAKPRNMYTYNIIEVLFDLVKADLGSKAEKYDLWGHSAGSQFSHRFTLHMPEARVDRVICSNAGFYTVPDPTGVAYEGVTYGYPNSILGINMDNEQLKAYFARNLTVHAGTADTATTREQDDQLPVGPGAEAQGACRYERAQFFYKRAKAVADSLGFPFNWKYVEVQGVGHSGTKMAQNSKTGAAVLLYGK